MTWAVKREFKEIVEKIVKLPRVNINHVAEFDNGKTVLSLATSMGCKEIVELLLKYPGIDINAKDKNGNTALSRASQGGHREIEEMLSRHQKENPSGWVKAFAHQKVFSDIFFSLNK